MGPTLRGSAFEREAGGCGESGVEAGVGSQDMHSNLFEHMGSFLEASRRTPFGG
jgi:hypothetical protein